jgi:hypothetical protein
MFVLTISHADDAIDTQSKKHPGRLVQEAGKWAFRGNDKKSAPISEFAYIHFSSAATPIPKATLTHTLHLPHQQRVAGLLQRVDAKKVTFITSWGATVELERDRVVGIEQARHGRILLYDDLDTSLQDWQREGDAKLDRERAFHGVASLLLDLPKQRALRMWKPALTDGELRLYFYDDGKSRCSFDLMSESDKAPISTLRIAADGYACEKQREVFGVLKGTVGWHQFNAELRAGRLRVYVDDACLGEIKADAIQGMRVSLHAGKVWIDELTVIQRLPVLPLPMPAKERDTIWLTHGEQLVGEVVSADRRTIALESKLGKRSLPWPQVRGIFFAQRKPTIKPTDAEITFRPGPGFSLDRLRAKLVRWDADKLIVQHALLGEIALERNRLDTIRPLAK